MNPNIKVLYAEDNPQDAELTCAHFAEVAPDFAIEIVATGEQCLVRLRQQPFDLLLLDHHLPDMEGLEVLKSLVHSSLQIPVVLVTGVGDEELVVKALRLGAINYVPKQSDYLATLPDLLRDVLQEQHQKHRRGRFPRTLPRRILYVEHLPMDIELTLRHFAAAAPHFAVEVVHTCSAALARLAQPHDYDLALIDLRMPDQSGLDFVREAKRLHLRLPPFIMVTSKGDDAAAIATLRLGAADYIAKREGYLDQLIYCIDHAIAHHRLNHLYEQLQSELSERIRAEAELRQTQEQLQRAVSAGQVGLWDWDIRTNKVYYSPEWKRQIGYSDDEITDDFNEWQSRVHPDDLETTLQVVQTYLDSNAATYEVEFRFRHQDGTYRHILARGSKLLGEDGAPLRMHGSHVDITERTQMQAQYLQAQKMASIGQLAGGIAHDFNNMLTVIIGMCDLGLRELREDDPLFHNFQQIREAGDRAAALTWQLLAFSRKQLLQPKILKLNTVVANLQSMLQRLLGEDIKLVFLPAQGLGNIQADAGQLEQVILNLALNARDAMPSGGTLTLATQEIEITAHDAHPQHDITPGSYLVLMVSDTGIGMDEATTQQIFEPFFTTKEVGKGTGLGLSTVYGIVKQSEGHIWVDSEPGKGTIFKIYLPRVGAVTRPDHFALNLTILPGTETILVAEDEAALRQLAQNVLGEAGYTVLTASNGSAALRLLEHHDGPVHLLFTDVVMPEMGGQHLATRLALMRPETKILFTSGYTDDEIIRHGVFDASAHFIAKPYTMTELTRKLRELLDATDERPASGNS
ncbi:MAG: response regulator [Acidobacteria bacterium]|nr:response regulator [Acidobacteriota bacterium]